jgi:pimeloyl-ACP methyl ester carboxylesterase
MPYASNQGVQIHYEVEGNGPSLVLLHGLGANLEAFREYGYVEALKAKYRLILIDVRGHGASDKPHDPEAYQTKLLVADVVAVLDQLRVEKAHFFGYSMGGAIGFGIAKYAPSRCCSMIIGGNHPYKPNADEQAELDSMIQLYKRGKDALVADVEKQLGPKMTPAIRTRLLASDSEAIVAMLSSELSTCSFEEVLPTMKMPCLFYAGENDEAYSGARQCVKSMPNAIFVSLPGLGHRDAIIQSNMTLPHITKFLEKVSQT